MRTLEQRFNRILSNYGRGFKKKEITGKKNQEEFSYLVHEVQMRGFDFEPEHYVKPLIEQLESLTKKS